MKEKELSRLEVLKNYENKLYSEGLNYIAGIDEAGRGPLAGPVVVACVILPKESLIEGIMILKRFLNQKEKKYMKK